MALSETGEKISLGNVCEWLGVPAGLHGETEIGGIACRAGEVQKGDLFVVIDEYLSYNAWERGEDHVREAIVRGATAILTENILPDVSVPQIRVSGARRALAEVSRRFYRCPDEDVMLIGVTGTNGKTTTSQLCAHLLRSSFGKTASMGTLGVFLNGEKIEEGEYTTDLAHVQNRRLRRLASDGVGAAAMEVSSHALTLDRVAELRFRVAVLTNLTRDHLDFHGSESAYGEAKRKLFRELPAEGIGVINADDSAAKLFAEVCPGRTVFYSAAGLKSAEIRAEEIECSPSGTRLVLVAGGNRFAVNSPLIGRFQVDNILAAAAVAYGLGADLDLALARVGDFLPVAGRMERISLPNGATAVVDFAHNPDGLANLLANCRELTKGRIHLVFGCGGDRDRGKRAIMGKIAEEKADLCWVTSDNPRTEDPERIAADILEAFEKPDVVRVELDRAEAIRKAYAETSAGDLLVVAGKGHERYQLIGDRKIPFSDAEVLKRNAEKLKS